MMKRRGEAAEDAPGRHSKRVQLEDPDLDDGVSEDGDDGDAPPALLAKGKQKREFGDDADLDEEGGGRRASKLANEAQEDYEEAYDENALDDLEGEEGNFEPFNLNAERELGKFGADGGFVWTRRDLDDEDDPWLEQDGKSVKPVRKTNASTTDDTSLPAMTQAEGNRIFQTIVRFLRPGETSLEALRRLKSDKAAFTKLTEACDSLLSQGAMSVYSEKRETFEKRLPALEWSYTVNGETHGPFSGADMEAWRQDGFFTSGEDVVMVRFVGGESKEVNASKVACFLVPFEE